VHSKCISEECFGDIASAFASDRYGNYKSSKKAKDRKDVFRWSDRVVRGACHDKGDRKVFPGASWMTF
jgi:hypothetical protein